MTDQPTIPDAAVEAVAALIAPWLFRDDPDFAGWWRDPDRRTARRKAAAYVATAYPLIAAHALREAADAIEHATPKLSWQPAYHKGAAEGAAICRRIADELLPPVAAAPIESHADGAPEPAAVIVAGARSVVDEASNLITPAEYRAAPTRDRYRLLGGRLPDPDPQEDR